MDREHIKWTFSTKKHTLETILKLEQHDQLDDVVGKYVQQRHHGCSNGTLSQATHYRGIIKLRKMSFLESQS